MTKDEAIAAADRRNKNKSKHLHHLRWVAVQTRKDLDSWNVELRDSREAYVRDPVSKKTSPEAIARAKARLKGQSNAPK